MKEKTCNICNTVKSLEDFPLYPDNGRYSKGARKPVCRSCGNERARRYFNTKYKTQEEKKRVRKHNDLKNMYGIGLDDYERMYEAQEGCCAICGDPQKVLNVDHCHDTGAVRELLCSPCNLALGSFKDDPLRVRKGLQYLEKHNAKS